ncbi:MAG: DNA replication and repair protein RecF [Aquificaceae bacterium]|nr:MAG: DNA replication and repair protein RecF [Aquificaceae bacterium]
MKLVDISIENCRKIRKSTLLLSPSLNLIIGDNGSGKTSIVEAFSILSSGRSFRTHRINDVITQGKKELLITARLKTNDAISHIGIKKSSQETHIRINKQDIRSQAELSQFLPITIIHPDSIKLIVGSPSERRRYLDWIGFYLIPEYHQLWKHHQRILKQRNAYLRLQKIGGDFDYWTQELIATQSKLHDKRLTIISLLGEELDFFRAMLLPENQISLMLSNGFSATHTFESLNTLDFYQSKLAQELKMKRTLYGIHKSDIKISLDNVPANISASRGQLKLIAISLLLAQSNTIKQRKKLSGLIIVDDMTSELDEANQQILLDTLSSLEQQVILTAPVLSKVLGKQKYKMFHVKHGVTSEATHKP